MGVQLNLYMDPHNVRDYTIIGIFIWLIFISSLQSWMSKQIKIEV